ncbi:hypothetical protein B9Z65_8688 [Elsinoe australis]|uniref:Major facilitator superfamily transporter n=1 Tax=Elsinoe australis TaxID=40998 RepID=A0A2P7YEG5_9PEZI|nr:hypothetical protein B9Z65_8688 [Elsinoe australis]
MGRFKREAYTALDGRLVDEEKRHSLDDDLDSEPESSYSSRDVSGSHVGLLSQNPPPTRKSIFSFSYPMRRRRFSRYFTCILATALVAFVLYLLHLKSLSEAQIRLGLKERPPPPPAPWEEFPFLKRYHGGVRTLVPRDANKPEYPDASKELEIGKKAQEKQEQEKQEAQKQGEGKEVEPKQEQTVQKRGAEAQTDAFVTVSRSESSAPRKQCFLDADDEIAVPPLQIHHGVPKGMPDPVMGSHEMFGIQNSGCFDRYGRLGPYGFGYSRKYGGTGAGMEGEGREEAMKGIWQDKIEIDYRKVNWADAQARCAYKNRNRFRQTDTSRNDFFTTMAQGTPARELEAKSGSEKKVGSRDVNNKGSGQSTKDDGTRLPRTALLIRTWFDYQYDDEDIIYLRALINELSLQSNGEYTVHFLIHVKDDNLQIWSDDETYQRVVDNALPIEFRGMGTLWSERQMGLIYGGVAESMYRNLPVHGVYRSTYMPVQYFAHVHPEYDFFWHWEMDARYTGHYYELFDKLGAWAKRQPRKGLWERNSRFYIPSEHGSYEDFSQMVRVQTEHGTGNRGNMYHKMSSDPKHPDQAEERPETPIWGPLRPAREDEHFEIDKDPQPPTPYTDDKYVWGVGEEADFITLNPLFDPDKTNWILNEDVTGYNTSEGFPPRRTAIITASRLSRRLLDTMHRETALKRHSMFSEMWPGSCALHHGLKAVYAPHPVYIDRRWPTSYLAAIFNNGRNGAAGGARASVFSDERQHNFLGVTWYYHAGFPANLWKRWLGYKVDGDGGEQEEKAGEGRMCLPSMLLHPVKQVDMIYEHQEGE